jgi:hypothetical protein
MPKLTGGGIQSSKRVEVGVRGGKPTTNVVSPRGVSEYGYATPGKLRQGAHTSENTAENVFERKAPRPPMGNAIATNVGKGGPGTGRTIYPSGFQSLHGAPVQGSTPPSKDTLAEYGPEVSDGSAMRRQR